MPLWSDLGVWRMVRPSGSGNSSFADKRREWQILSPLRTDSLPLVSKIYWRESADNAIIDAP